MVGVMGDTVGMAATEDTAVTVEAKAVIMEEETLEAGLLLLQLVRLR